MKRLSACLITFNEEHNLPRALASLAGMGDEIVVLDSGGPERTAEIAKAHGVSFFERPFNNHADQKNYAASCARNNWIVLVGGDEGMSSDLRNSLLEWKEREPEFPVYEMARLTWYLGAWIQHSRWYPDFQRRLYRRDKANFSGMIHSALRFEGKAARLTADLLPYTIPPFPNHEAQVQGYTTVIAHELFSQGKRSWRAAMWLAAPVTGFRITCCISDFSTAIADGS